MRVLQVREAVDDLLNPTVPNCQGLFTVCRGTTGFAQHSGPSWRSLTSGLKGTDPRGTLVGTRSRNFLGLRVRPKEGPNSTITFHATAKASRDLPEFRQPGTRHAEASPVQPGVWPP